MNDVVGQSVHSHGYHEDSQANKQMTTIKVSSVLRQTLEKLRERRFLREDWVWIAFEIPESVESGEIGRERMLQVESAKTKKKLKVSHSRV